LACAYEKRVHFYSLDLLRWQTQATNQKH
jgi:hypothetical protein